MLMLWAPFEKKVGLLNPLSGEGDAKNSSSHLIGTSRKRGAVAAFYAGLDKNNKH